jgi:ABC transport system ATP-binding/permease protein
VSHDRAFVDHVATSIIAWEGDESPGQWREYEGSVQDWLTQRARAAQIREKAAAGKNSSQISQQPAENKREQLSKNEQLVPAPAKTRKLSYKEQREFDALPATIQTLEEEQRGIAARLADGKLYANDPALATQLAQRSTAIDDELLACLERQEALS